MMPNVTIVNFTVTSFDIYVNMSVNVTIKTIHSEFFDYNYEYLDVDNSTIKTGVYGYSRKKINNLTEYVAHTTNLTLIQEIYSQLPDHNITITENEIIISRFNYYPPVTRLHRYIYEKSTGWIKNLYVRKFNTSHPLLGELNTSTILITSQTQTNNPNSPTSGSLNSSEKSSLAIPSSLPSSSDSTSLTTEIATANGLNYLITLKFISLVLIVRKKLK